MYPVILTDHISRIANFWRAHYRGSDWTYDPTPGVVEKLVGSYIQDTHVYFFCLANKRTEEPIATIVSTPLTRGSTILGPPTYTMPECRVIEGLCVRGDYRGKGIAGFMIAYMDYFTSVGSPVAHLWSRELAIAPLPLFSTALNVKQYAYVKSADVIPKQIGFKQIEWSDFSKLWSASAPYWVKEPCIVASIPQNRRGDLRVYIAQESFVVITDTRRVTVPAGEKIWEVVWCGKLERGKLQPATALDFQQLLCEITAVDLKGGILFALDPAGSTGTWIAPWVSGRSGVHAWYIYNFVPPAFGSCELHAVREEI